MSHYFDTPTTDGPTRVIQARIWGQDYTFTTTGGVFSGTRLDLGTSILLREVYPSAKAKRILDLGCGYGPIAIALASELPDAQIDAVDVNERALELTRLNASSAGVSDQVTAFNPTEANAAVRYDEIWSNPPIRIGKAALHAMLLEWLPRLADGGRAFLVVNKNLGADSLQAWLIQQGWTTTRIGSAKGFRVFEVSHP